MAKKAPLHRRFIRLQAVQQLYAFSVCRQANEAHAFAQLGVAFAPDVYGDPSLGPEQLARAEEAACILLRDWLGRPGLPVHAQARVEGAVRTALAGYRASMEQDLRQLAQGLVLAVGRMNRACVRVWQLLAAWGRVAQQQAERPRLMPGAGRGASLAGSVLLQRLAEGSNLAALAAQVGGGWDVALVEDWYHQWVKNNTKVQACLAALPEAEEQLLATLLEDVVFGQEAIQEVFEELDLHWALHRGLVRQQVRQGLALLVKTLDKEVTLEVFGADSHWAEVREFYTTLLERTLAHEPELEELMQQKSQNWPLERMMLVDKVILKLALCEMMYFPVIPVKVSINEYIEIAKSYGVPKSQQFVNGLLDAVAQTLGATAAPEE